MRPEHEERFANVVAVLAPMLRNLHKMNQFVLSSQLISTRPLVWVERYPDNETMERAIGPLTCARAYCSSDDHHTMVSTYVSGMRQIAKLRRVVALGRPRRAALDDARRGRANDRLAHASDARERRSARCVARSRARDARRRATRRTRSSRVRTRIVAREGE